MPGGRTPRGRGRNRGRTPGGRAGVASNRANISETTITPSEQQTSPNTDSGSGDTPQSPDTDVQQQTTEEVKKLKKGTSGGGGGQQGIKFIIKNTTGHPTSPLNSGVIEINTFDNKIFMYADGGWRELATW